MPFNHGKFGPTRPGAVKSSGEKTPPASTPHEKEHGKPQAAHGASSEKHVTETHPGKTQPHPVTGVHSFHAMHKGGGKYESHTHHDGGEVETREHPSAGDMHQSMNEALPDDQQQGENEPPMDDDSQMFQGDLGGIGGE